MSNPNDIRLVAVQAKNKMSGTLDDCLTTLNPGMQYLTNKQRNEIIDSIYCDEVLQRKLLSSSDSQLVGYEKRYWEDHVSVCNTHSSIGKHWFRIALTAGEIDENLLAICRNLLEDTSRTILSFRSNAKYKVIAKSLSQSPLIILSVTSPDYLTYMRLSKLIDEEPHGKLALPRSTENGFRLRLMM